MQKVRSRRQMNSILKAMLPVAAVEVSGNNGSVVARMAWKCRQPPLRLQEGGREALQWVPRRPPTPRPSR